MRPSSDRRYSGNVSNPSKGMPSSADESIPSTRANSWMSQPASPGRSGATENPQLPATTVVTPWKQLDVAYGSNVSCGS